MKYRNGFVSNSSSSSFCIVGVQGHKLIERIKELDQFDGESADAGYGCAGTGKRLKYYGAIGEPWWIGLDAEIVLENRSITEARPYVQKVFKDVGVDINIDDIDLQYGEASSE